MPHGRRSQGPMLALHAHQERFEPVIREHVEYRQTPCCVPTGCLSPDAALADSDRSATVRVLCNNDGCPFSGFMHRLCFDNWEMGILNFLRSSGRARSWSEKQRHQNLWTKKGYDLAYRACTCLCQRGHLKKDLDWGILKAVVVEEEACRKRRRNRAGKPTPTLTIQTTMACPRDRANSLGSTGSSPPSSGSESPNSPQHHQQHHQPPVQSVNNGVGTVSVINGCKKKQVNPKSEYISERLRHTSGSGIFTRRADFSAFNALPKHKVNSYHIKMEDEGSQGNDDTRSFLLSSLASARMSHTYCVVCSGHMNVYDRYPIVDGTFFLSPRQHSRACVQVRYDNRVQFLSAVCMGCLEGWSVRLHCRGCRKPWDGSQLVLGTMYTYDIFAAAPCCPEWLKCHTCERPVIAPDQRLTFYSDYSHILSCRFCTSVSHHFVKPLTLYQPVDPRSPAAT